ncbi:hypothetical protein BT93_L0479 [Corymbia citriodora subsp. variegata]|uniref:AB hydrolase-1 domain-containing protein n=1 Tax=Corymbia citriodora subsp. variegata TaxID=360336 RepID=A0A8T0CUF5_CORYI|nr:hypothetical protein BT93_L0479 [Corymbia citriodora subsp. variegata]
MTKCFSFAATFDRCCRFSFSRAGLKSTTTDLGDGTVMHCWVPKTYKPNKPNLLLLHGLGACGMWQWSMSISRFIERFNVYVPDLLFFGDSYSTRPERTEQFQAKCVAGRTVDFLTDRIAHDSRKTDSDQHLTRFAGVLKAQGVRKANVVGPSYGGFVAYSLAAQFPEMVEKLVLWGAGVCVDEKDLEDGMFQEKSMDEAVSTMLPQTPEKMKEMLKFVFYKPVWNVPTCFLQDFIDFIGMEHLQEWRALINASFKDRKISTLPKITQPTLIIWGEYDKVFPLELGHRLKRHLDENAQLVVIKDCGHAATGGELKEMYKRMQSFLVDPLLSPEKANQTKGQKVL